MVVWASWWLPGFVNREGCALCLLFSLSLLNPSFRIAMSGSGRSENNGWKAWKKKRKRFKKKKKTQGTECMLKNRKIICIFSIFSFCILFAFPSSPFFFLPFLFSSILASTAYHFPFPLCTFLSSPSLFVPASPRGVKRPPHPGNHYSLQN